jgi:hypothetical protein
LANPRLVNPRLVNLRLANPKKSPSRFSFSSTLKTVSGIFLVLVAVLAPVSIEGQQTGARPYYVEAGGYHIGVLSNPSSLSLGTIDYIVTLNDPETARPISDARVLIRAVKASGEGQEGWANALNTPGNPDRYTARVQLGEPGVWKMSIEVSSPLGHVRVGAPSQVVPQPRRTQAGGLVFIGVFIALGLGVLYAWWSIRRAQRQRGPTSGS